MSKYEVLDWNKKKVGEVEMPAEVFEQPLRNDLLQAVVRWQLACRRQGTHQAKTKGEVRGGGKKPFKQKGTGSARQGTNRSPLMPGGGITFGPRPRDYSYQLPKKVRSAGLAIALSYLKSNGRLWVVDEMSSQGKTKEVAQRLKKFGVDKALLVDANIDEQMKRACRNLVTHKYCPVMGVNVFDLLKYDAAIVTKASIEKIVSRCVGA